MSHFKPMSRTFMSIATMGVLALAPIMAAPASALTIPTPASTATTTVEKSMVKVNDANPFGNGSSDQTYKYADSIRAFDFKAYGVPANTKVEVAKWNWNLQKWETYKTYSPTSTGDGFLSYKIATPKSAEGKSEAYLMRVPETTTTEAWSGEITYIRTTHRATVNLSSKTTPFGAMKEVKAAPSSNSLGSWTWSGITKESGNFYLQESQKGKWVNVAKVTKAKASNGTWNMKYSIPVRKFGTVSSYRLSHPATSTAKAWTGATQRVSYKANATDFYEKSGALWSGVQKRWTVNRTDALTNVQVLNGAGRTVYLQKYDSKKKKWNNVSSSKLNNTNYAKGKLTVPKITTGSNVTYRVHIPANSYYAADTSASTTVKYEDPRKYTGFRKNVYNHIKKYCPNIIIEGANQNKEWHGIAYMNEQRIKVVYGLSAGRFKKVSLHECAHIIQGNVYGQDYKALTKAADKVYGKGKGVEQMADCMAFKMGADVKHYTYTKNCKGTRGTVAAKVLSGKRI